MFFLNKKYFSALISIFFLIGCSYSAFASKSSLPTKVAFYTFRNNVPAFKGDNKFHAVYELYISNFSKKKVRLLSLNIKGFIKNRRVFTKSIKNKELSRVFSSIAGNYMQPQKPELSAGETGILFVMLDFNSFYKTPDNLINRIAIKAGSKDSNVESIPLSSIIKITKNNPIIIYPPLKGKNWFSMNAISDFSNHRRAVIVLDGKVFLPERYAVDWIILDKNHKSYHGDKNKNSSYYAYGAPLLAVANGKVVAIKDGVPNNVPNSGKLAVPLTLDTIGGNYVILKLGDNHYALYAHIMPDSIKVKLGQQVKRGEVIGLLGNSGNSTEPHLHFHIINAPSPLRGEGLPFLLNKFIQEDRLIYDDNTDTITRVSTGKPHEMHNQAVVEGDMIDF